MMAEQDQDKFLDILKEYALTQGCEPGIATARTIREEIRQRTPAGRLSAFTPLLFTQAGPMAAVSATKPALNDGWRELLEVLQHTLLKPASARSPGWDDAVPVSATAGTSTAAALTLRISRLFLTFPAEDRQAAHDSVRRQQTETSQTVPAEQQSLQPGQCAFRLGVLTTALLTAYADNNQQDIADQLRQMQPLLIRLNIPAELNQQLLEPLRTVTTEMDEVDRWQHWQRFLTALVTIMNRQKVYTGWLLGFWLQSSFILFQVLDNAGVADNQRLLAAIRQILHSPPADLAAKQYQTGHQTGDVSADGLLGDIIAEFNQIRRTLDQ